MKHFDIDLSKVASVVNKDSYRLQDVSHRLEKIAFDVFRMKDGDPDELWQVQSADDGEFIVCKYTEELEPKTASLKNSWEAIVSEKDTLQLFYKNTPVVRIPLSSDQISTVATFLPNKLVADQSFRKALIASLSDGVRASLLNTYPELSQ